MKMYSSNIVSPVEAFRVKDSERLFLANFRHLLPGTALMKIAPFRQLWADLYYEQDGHVMIVKFMDTTPETFSILEEELLEIMQEESSEFLRKIARILPQAQVRYLFFLPYVQLGAYRNDFIHHHIIDQSRFERLQSGAAGFDAYLSASNPPDTVHQLRYILAREYHILRRKTPGRRLNPDLAPIYFKQGEQDYQITALTASQIRLINSVKYGATLFTGPAGCGKTTTLFARLVRLCRVYGKDRFLFLTFSRQLTNDLHNNMEMMKMEFDNIEVVNFHSFILSLARQYNLRIDSQSKRSFDEQFEAIFEKVRKIYADKNYYKGIFIDEAENFSKKHLEFLQTLLEKKKHFFMVSADKAKDIRGFMETFTGGYEYLEFDDIAEFTKNYRASKPAAAFTNAFIRRVQQHLQEKGLQVPQDYYMQSLSRRAGGPASAFCRVPSVEEMLEQIIALVQKKLQQERISCSDICIIYPFNKRRIKSQSVIYFQYMLRMALEKACIPYLVATEEITNLNPKSGITISNIYSINNLEYPHVILCELEMLYVHDLGDNPSAHQKLSFIKNINIIYTALTRATDCVTVFSVMQPKDSPLIDMLEPEAPDFID